MIDLKDFRKTNNLTQSELASYLGVLQGFVSQVEKGTRPMPNTWVKKLSDNPNGWDTSMLTKATHVGDNRVTAKVAGNGSVSTNINYGGDECTVLKERIKYLEQSLAEKERLIEEKERLIGVLLERK